MKYYGNKYSKRVTILFSLAVFLMCYKLYQLLLTHFSNSDTNMNLSQGMDYKHCIINFNQFLLCKARNVQCIEN